MIPLLSICNSHLKRLRDLANFANNPNEIVFLAELWSLQQKGVTDQSITEVTNAIQSHSFGFNYTQPKYSRRSTLDFLGRLVDARILIRNKTKKTHTYRLNQFEIQTDLLLHWVFSLSETLPQYNIPLKTITRNRNNDKYDDLSLINPLLALVVAQNVAPTVLATKNAFKKPDHSDRPNIGASVFQKNLTINDARWKNLRSDLYLHDLLEKGDDILKEVLKYSLGDVPLEKVTYKPKTLTNMVELAIHNQVDLFKDTFSMTTIEQALENEGIKIDFELKEVVRTLKRKGRILVDQNYKDAYRTLEGGSQITNLGVGILNKIYVPLIEHSMRGNSSEFNRLSDRYKSRQSFGTNLNSLLVTHAIQIEDLPRQRNYDD